MKKLFILLIALTLLPIFPAFCEEDEEISITEWVEEVDLDTGEVFVTEVVAGEVDEAEDESTWYESDGSVLITLSATGDVTIGGDSRKKSNPFEKELKKHGGDVNFTMANVRDIFWADDLTIVNFEGTLTDSTFVPANKKENQFLFSAPPSYAAMLSNNGIEAAALENNHVMDHGEDAYADTQKALDEAGVVWSNSENRGIYTVKGVSICMLSYLCIDRYDKLWEKVPADIAAAKEQYPVVIVSFHWGNEKEYTPTRNQIKMGRLAVDSGADLVLGHHSHRIQPIEYYNGVYICYSLGNFCFAGNNKPSDMSSFIFQARLRVKDGETSTQGFRIIPVRISSRRDRNDYTPTPLTDDTAIDSILTTLKANGKKLDYVVESYPLDW